MTLMERMTREDVVPRLTESAGTVGLPRARQHRGGGGWLLPVLIPLAFFATLAPTLACVEFVNGSEDAVVATALDIRRGGPWWVPHLFGEPRTNKPPLAAWAAAAGVRPATVEAINSPDIARRHAGFRRLRWQVRLGSLAAGCGLLAAVYGLGRVVGGWRVGLAAALACGSTLMFLLLRFSYLPTTDIHLALWVAVASYGFALALLDGRRWAGCLIGGAALGLALMSKGPVALVQAALPLLAFAAWRRWHRRRGATDPVSTRGSMTGPLLAAAAAALAIGLPWYVSVAVGEPGIWQEWAEEVTREGATEHPPGAWYNYLLIVPLVFPWTAFLVAGLIDGGRFVLRGDGNGRASLPAVGATQVSPSAGLVKPAKGDTCVAPTRGPTRRDRPTFERGTSAALPLFLLVVPLVVLSFFRDRELRYLVPSLAPAAVVAAWGLRRYAESRARPGALEWLHWAGLGALAVSFFALAAAGRVAFFRTATGGPWYSWPAAAALTAACVALISAAVAMRRRGWGGVVPAAVTTAAVMLIVNGAYQAGYGSSTEGRSNLKRLADVIWSARPGAIVYSLRTDKPARHAPRDLEIYLNRPIWRVFGPAEIPAAAAGEGQVLVVAVQAGDPAPVPAGWVPIGQVTEKSSTWRAYARPAPATTRLSPGNDLTAAPEFVADAGGFPYNPADRHRPPDRD